MVVKKKLNIPHPRAIKNRKRTRLKDNYAKNSVSRRSLRREERRKKPITTI